MSVAAGPGSAWVTGAASGGAWDGAGAGEVAGQGSGPEAGTWRQPAARGECSLRGQGDEYTDALRARGDKERAGRPRSPAGCDPRGRGGPAAASPGSASLPPARRCLEGTIGSRLTEDPEERPALFVRTPQKCCSWAGIRHREGTWVPSRGKRREGLVTFCPGCAGGGCCSGVAGWTHTCPSGVLPLGEV